MIYAIKKGYVAPNLSLKQWPLKEHEFYFSHDIPYATQSVSLYVKITMVHRHIKNMHNQNYISNGIEHKTPKTPMSHYKIDRS